jgi:gliding motility-associatede transport system auxiliary component
MNAAEALARPSPIEILRTWPSAGGRIETIALHLSGNLQTAFPNGRPEAAPADTADSGEAVHAAAETPAPPATAATAALSTSATPAEIVIVSDADFLADDFYVDQSGAPAADNASFALNAIDVLGGSDALVSLRSRAPSLRRMTMLEDMERDAQRRIESRQEDLQRELHDTETQLADLQRRGRGSGFFSGNLGAELTPEENAAIARFRARVVEVRGELRGAERNLRGDIDRLKAIVVFVNMWLGPILVAAIGLFLFWRRQRRARIGAGR